MCDDYNNCNDRLFFYDHHYWNKEKKHRTNYTDIDWITVSEGNECYMIDNENWTSDISQWLHYIYIYSQGEVSNV